VVLSPAFFRKHWPQAELDALAQREVEGQKVILPVWYNVTTDRKEHGQASSKALRVAYSRVLRTHPCR
jgi:hypothetical protein